jgi:hypothetical protein
MRIMDTAEDDDAWRWTAEARARAEAIAKALQELNPRLERFPFDYKAIAELEQITEDEARARNQHIELNGPEGGSPVQVEIQADHASISVPYWYSGDESREKLGEMFTYLAAIESVAGWKPYDPQIGRVIDVLADIDAVASMYEVGTQAAQGLKDDANDDGEPDMIAEERKKKRFGLF